jgi:hypothetical protein
MQFLFQRKKYVSFTNIIRPMLLKDMIIAHYASHKKRYQVSTYVLEKCRIMYVKPDVL